MIDRNLFIDGICEKYPEKLIENSASIEGTVCATLLKDILLYDDCGISSEDFITKDGKLLFYVVKSLREKGFSVFDEITYMTNIDQRVINMINDQVGGFRQLQRMIDVVSVNNWDSYEDNLNKRNIYLTLYNKNFNVLSEIDMRTKKGEIKRIVPIEYFDKFTSTEVLEFYEQVIADLGTRIRSSKITEEAYVDFDDEWLNSLEQKSEVGVSFGSAGLDTEGNTIYTFPFMDKQILGLMKGTLNCWGAFSGNGKSTYMVAILMSLASRGIKSIVVTNEMQIKQYKTLFLLFILTRHFHCYEISKRTIDTGSWTKEQYEKYLLPARELWREKYSKMIHVVSLDDADASLTCQIFKKWILREGCEAFLVDTFKLSIGETGAKDSGWVDIVKDTRDLDALAKRYNVIGLMTVQLAGACMNRSYLDSSCLSNCKAIKEVLTNLVLFRKVTDDELDPNSPYYIRPYRSKQREDGTWYDEPFEPDRTKSWRVAFIDKSRRGADSADRGGEAYMWKFQGDYGKFSETCKCRPTRKLLPGTV